MTKRKNHHLVHQLIQVYFEYDLWKWWNKRKTWKVFKTLHSLLFKWMAYNEKYTFYAQKWSKNIPVHRNDTLPIWYIKIEHSMEYFSKATQMIYLIKLYQIKNIWMRWNTEWRKSLSRDLSFLHQIQALWNMYPQSKTHLGNNQN